MKGGITIMKKLYKDYLNAKSDVELEEKMKEIMLEMTRLDEYKLLA